MSRSDSYYTRGDADSIEDLSKKLTADLRRHIRALGPCDVLSERWIEVGDVLGRIASISQMEKSLPKAEGASLWDCEELALRYVLEDGKLNLCLRLLDEYQEFVNRMTADKRAFSVDQAEQLDRFDRGVGGLLANAWLHSEALQTTDLPLVFKIISTAFRSALADESADPYDGKIPATAVHFMFAIGKALDAVGERKIFAEILSTDAFGLLAQHLVKNFDKLRVVDRVKGAEGLALLAAGEDFSTHKARIVGSVPTQAALSALDALYVKDLASDMESRRKLRPLLDLISEAKRKLGK